MIRKKHIVTALFVLYAAVMLYMMVFGRLYSADFRFYTDYLKSHTSLIPFRFIYDYILSVLKNGIYNTELRNIIGNTMLFLPVGIFLPYFSEKVRSFGRILISTALIITVIELIQLLLTIGTFDIDDIMLNCTGALAGYLIYKKAAYK